jgi:hypothetical protein
VHLVYIRPAVHASLMGYTIPDRASRIRWQIWPDSRLDGFDLSPLSLSLRVDRLLCSMGLVGVTVVLMEVSMADRRE